MSLPESNPLRAALAGSTGPDDHPDAGLLTAFAESTLPLRERQEVLDHLARCAECREVLAVAQDAAPVPAGEGAQSRWWRLRVLASTLAAAAAVIVVSVVVFERQTAQNAKPETAAVNPVAAAPPQAPQYAPTPVPQGEKAPESKALARKVTPVPAAAATGAASAATAENSGMKTTLASARRVPEAPSQAASGGTAAASGRFAEPAAPPVGAFANTLTAEALKRAPASKLQARPHWRINAQGQVERAFAGGPWMPAISNVSGQMRVVSVFGGEVWVGGEKSQVFRSPDSGETWNAVVLPEKGGAEHTILHIRFGPVGEVRIEASDGTIWTSADGGNTWN